MISIVVLSYNHEKYIGEALSSVFGLNIQKEVIVIDDCSKDSSVKVIQDVIAKHDAADYTKTVLKDKNAGLIDSLNIGLNMASSDYIYFIASDDVIDVDGFTALYNTLCLNDKAHFIMGNAWVYYTGQEVSEIVYKENHKKFFLQNDNNMRKRIFTDFPKPLLLQATIFKKQTLVDIGGWDTSLAWDDYPMFVKLLQKYSLNKREFLFSDEIVTVKYRQHDSNAYKNLDKQLKMVEAALLKLAPQELYSDAIARQYAFYFLLAGKVRDHKIIKYLLKKMIKERIVTKTIYYMYVEIYQWIQRKKK